jgi:hypothetical protein
MTTAIDGTPLVYGKADQGFLNPDYIAWGDRAAVQDLCEFGRP